MMRKLLYSFLFFIFPKFLSKRSYKPSLGLLCVGLFFVVSFADAATYYSRRTGNWTANSTWSTSSGGTQVGVGIYPVAGDIVIIERGFTVSINANVTCGTLQVGSLGAGGGNNYGEIDFSGAYTLTVTGNSTFGGNDSTARTGTITFVNGAAFNTGSLNVGNPNSGTKAAGIIDMASGGTMNVSGAIVVTAVGGNSWNPGSGTVMMSATNNLPSTLFTSFYNLTINSGTTTFGTGLIINGDLAVTSGAGLVTGGNSLTLRGNFVNGGTFIASSSSVTLSGTANQSIAGFATTGAVSMTKTGGTATFTGNVNGGALTINGSGGTLNLGSGLIHTFTGNWTRANGTLNASSSTLKIGSDVSGTGGTFTRGTSTVEFYRSGAQNLGTNSITYYNLVLSGSGLKTFGSLTTINNLLSIGTGVQAALGSSVHPAGILTLGGAGPLTSTWGSTSSNPVAQNTNDTFFATGNIGKINVNGTAPGSAIDNNYASYSVTNGISGDIAGSSGEYGNPPLNTTPGSVTLTAPAGTVFINVKFASYGSPGGTSPNFTIGSCHAFNSRTETTTLLGNTTATIPTAGRTFNEVFGDPCYGIVKSYNVVATYSTPICAGTNPGRITGSTPTGGNVAAGATGTYSYLWEVSTTDAKNGYSVAPGVSDGKDYDIPNVINVPTWYRRTVTSGIYSDATIVVIPVNIPGQLSAPTSVNPPSTSVCAGTPVTLSVNGGTSGTNKGGYAEWTLGSCTGPLVGRSTLLNGSLTITPTADATYYVKYKNACGETACAPTPVTVTNPTSITLTTATSTVTTCSPSNTTTALSLGYSATKGSPTTYSIAWSAAANSAGFANKTDISFTAAASNGSGTISNAINLPVNVAAGTYTGTLTVKTGSCVSFGNAISVTVNPRPTSAVSGTTVICRGASTPISVTFTGTAPWSFSYSYGGTTGTYSTSSNPYTVNVSPTTSTTYSITALRDATGCDAVAADITGTATITVNAPPLITTQPSVRTICSGSNTTFGVVASGTGLTYKWQFSTDGTNFNDLSNGGVYSDVGTATMTITGVTSGINNYQYRVLITGTCGSVTSNAAALTVNAAPSISGQPSGSSLCAGSDATFGVTTSGAGLTYKWQVSTNGGNNFSDLSEGGVYSNTGTALMNITGATSGMNNYQYRVVINGTCSPAVTSNPATLVVNPIPTPSITKNNDVSCNSLGSITLTNLPASWTINQTGAAVGNYNGTTATQPIEGLVAGRHYFTVTNSTTGCISSSVFIDINNTTLSTDWGPAGWTNGPPDGNRMVTISSLANGQPFTTPNEDIYACSLTVTVTSGDVIIPSGVTLNITNAVTSNGKLVFESGSSLVQSTGIANTGEIVYKRTTNLRRYDVVYWSTPVENAAFKMNNLSPNTFYDKYFYWDVLSGKWVTSPNGVEPMKIGTGYNIRGPQDHEIETAKPFVGIFTGVPNNGNIPITVEPNKWNFLGNPYPSAIDADELILVTNKDNIGALYFWTHNQPPQIVSGTNTYRYVSSDYLVYNGVGSIRVNQPGTDLNDEFKGNIAAGQGFFAMPAGSVINFNNSMRRGSSENTQFYKTAKTNKIEKNRIWLNVANSQGAFKQMLIGYVEGATNGNDLSFDAVTMGNNTYVDFYSINEGKKLTIQGRALPFDNTEIIPLGFKCGVDATGDRNFTFSLDHTDGFFDTQEIYLEDKILGKIIDLRKENYTFPSGTGTYSTRFVLRFTNKTLGTDDFENLENSVLVSVKDKVVKITSSKETIKEVNIYNIGAQLLYSNEKVNASELQITNLHSSDQVVLVNITLENGYNFTKKVIFSNL